MGSLLIHFSISFQGEGRGRRRTFPASGPCCPGRRGALLLVGAASCNGEELSPLLNKEIAALRFQRLLSPVARGARAVPTSP